MIYSIIKHAGIEIRYLNSWNLFLVKYPRLPQPEERFDYRKMEVAWDKKSEYIFDVLRLKLEYGRSKPNDKHNT